MQGENMKTVLFLYIIIFHIDYVSAKPMLRRYTFTIESTRVTRLCKTQNIITVNGMFPGPTLDVNMGDTVHVNVINKSPHNATIHWHGIRQFCSPWADGPAYVTQCPIKPNNSYVYRFSVYQKAGTLWWHAHVSWLRGTVYGALIIRKHRTTFMGFPSPLSLPTPKGEVVIMLGEWWNGDPVQIIRQTLSKGGGPPMSDALTINGQPGDLYPCSSSETYRIEVVYGRTYHMRLINAAVNTELFFAIASHKLTVIEADASKVKPYTVDTVFIAPGQTLDLFFIADQHQPLGLEKSSYYMAASGYASNPSVPIHNGTTTAILQYSCSYNSRNNTIFPIIPLPNTNNSPQFPNLPPKTDTPTVQKFSSLQRSLRPHEVPQHVDKHLFFTVGLGLLPCNSSKPCQGPNGSRFAGSINNISFVSPTTASILEAYYYNIPGIFTTNFPAVPSVIFNYTSDNISSSLFSPVKATKLKMLDYNATVEIVFQDTNIVAGENHPMHLHGYDFYVVGSGFGNFDPVTAPSKLNLVDPPKRNSVAVPVSGWAAIRFKADNPGVWLLHCHLDVHLSWGLSTALLVKNGPDEYTSLRPPPQDLPPC